ncbi:uncharacterized protein KY384_002340 [Bacidia gigantensis]|uniref:uncharacterized protein n=1 Tax=Bacidia gigantensis TaxID=2732470 RepID=UPI001D052B7A|nr:uncharacterized protein KY384_002340 [Bacidia gigantensis]KAG8532463.1 hypothetical protein KY384_002340 [Bacidia gigantensis]
MSKYKTVGGSKTLFRGGCKDAKSGNAVVQIGINVLSTLILGASNYCMHCLAAPNREEVDRAHARKKFLHIGIPALRNLKWISRYRAIVWVILGITALPIHFLYNSVLILTTQANKYQVMAGPENLLEPEFNATNFYGTGNHTHLREKAYEVRHRISSGEFQQMEAKDCIDNYVQQYVSKWGDLMVIQDGDLAGEDGLGQIWDGKKIPYDHNALVVVESDEQDFPDNGTYLLPHGSTLYVDYDYQADYQASNIVEDDQWTALAHGGLDFLEYNYPGRTNVTLLRNFPLTADPRMFPTAYWQCLGLIDYESSASSDCNRTTLATILNGVDKWKPFGHEVKHCWSEIVEEECSLTLNVGICMAVIACNFVEACCMCLTLLWIRRPGLMTIGDAIELFLGLTMSAVSLGVIQEKDGQFQIGIGTQAGKNNIANKQTLVSAVLLANFPQIFSSYIFIGFNYILTSMFAGREWISYSQRRKPLRVTNPKGQQSSTYYLQLPYRFSIPLLAISGLISWLTSQVLFVVRVQIRDSSGVNQPDDFILACGYSPGAIVITILVGTVLGLAVLVIGLKKLPDTMPLAGTNSAAIAAACHALHGDEDSALKPVKWGVVSDDGDFGHCSFSAGPVEPLVAGRLYR